MSEQEQDAAGKTIRIMEEVVLNVLREVLQETAESPLPDSLATLRVVVMNRLRALGWSE